uniref:H-orf protein n=1 Tax=Utterbackia imbecillis TaxID=52383 RepID=F4ZG24_9BIVA|nr:h-orf protein [Utterbackia imbecillis]
MFLIKCMRTLTFHVKSALLHLVISFNKFSNYSNMRKAIMNFLFKLYCLISFTSIISILLIVACFLPILFLYSLEYLLILLDQFLIQNLYFMEVYAISPQTSAETMAQTSAEASAQTSAEASAQTSAETSAEASAQTSAETSAEASAQTSAEASAETSTKDHPVISPHISASDSSVISSHTSTVNHQSPHTSISDSSVNYPQTSAEEFPTPHFNPENRPSGTGDHDTGMYPVRRSRAVMNLAQYYNRRW